MFRRSAILLGATALALMFSACSGADPNASSDRDGGAGPSGTITIAASAEPETLDFMTSTTGSTKLATVNVIEGLFAHDDTWTPHPMLASDVKVSPDSKTYTITLRDVKFHNGEPLEAEDVVASIKRWMSVDKRAARWFEDMTSLTAKDTKTVEFVFSSPTPSLPNTLASIQAGIIPKEIAAAAGDGVLKSEQLIGTGPFMFEDWQQGVAITLKANPDYAPVDGKPMGLAGHHEARAAKIVIKPVLDESARLSGLQTGEFNYAEALPTDQYDAIKKDSNLKLALRNVGAVTAFLNSQSTGPTGNPAIRRALMVALDMDEVGAAQGPSDLWNLSPSLPASTTRLASEAGTENWNAKDPGRARQEAQAAGYKGETLTVITTSSPNTYRFAVVLQEQLQKAGFKVKLATMETAAMQERRAQPSGWDIALGQANTTSDVTESTALTCGNTSGGYCSDQMNKLMKDFRDAPDAQKQAMQDALQTFIYQEVPLIKGPEILVLNATNGLSGFEQSDLSVHHFWNTSVG